MSTYSNRLIGSFQNLLINNNIMPQDDIYSAVIMTTGYCESSLSLLQCVVRFFHPRSSCTTTHISVDVQKITLNMSCITILGENRTTRYILPQAL